VRHKFPGFLICECSGFVANFLQSTEQGAWGVTEPLTHLRGFFKNTREIVSLNSNLQHHPFFAPTWVLIEAIQFTNRAYIFDNSTHEHIWLAEITNGHLLEMKTDQVPAWLKKALGSKFNIGNA